MSAVLKPPLAELREMTVADVRQVTAIESRAYSFPWTRGLFEDCLRVGYCCVVYQIGDTLVGYGIMSAGAGECHLLNVCVDPPWQRHGLGRRMVEELLERARRATTRIALLEVRVSNIGAYRLYREMGFEVIASRAGYYPAHGGREKAVVLAKMLDGGAGAA